MGGITKAVTLYKRDEDYDDETLPEGDEFTVNLPAKWEICGTCEGHGRALKSSLRGAVYTQSDFEEDPDLRDHVRDVQRGVYDDMCEECRGSGKVLEVDEESIRPDLRERYLAHMEEEYEYEATCRAERAMELGMAGDMEGYSLARRGYLR
jgi:hypothetical protein